MVAEYLEYDQAILLALALALALAEASADGPVHLMRFAAH